MLLAVPHYEYLHERAHHHIVLNEHWLAELVESAVSAEMEPVAVVGRAPSA